MGKGKHKAGTLAAVALAGVLVLLCAGCQPQGPAFTRERYRTVYVHEPTEQVRQKLGEPARSTSDYWDYVNRRPTHYEARIWISRPR